MKNKEEKITEDILWMLICGLQIIMNTIRMIDTGTHLYSIFIILFSISFGLWTMILIDDIKGKR